MGKQFRFTALIAALAILAAAPAGAQQLETVVVTGSRIDDGAPHIAMTKRADFLITRVRVTCDTRDPAQRREELKATLRDMIRAAAKTPTLSLGQGEDIIGELSETNFDEIIVPDVRPDTSQAHVVIKTAISPGDSFDAATARIKAFIAKAPKTGRTEILREERWDLTIVGPEQYRDRIVGQIVADAKHTADLFGPGYTTAVNGLERRIEWLQRGPLDLALFIPYQLEIKPSSAH